jgi:hypothetical protein
MMLLSANNNLNMRKLIAILVLFCSTLSCYSQIRVGPILGLNISKGTSDNIRFSTEAKVKPQIGVITNYSLSEKIDLESGLIANFKGQNFTATYTDYDQSVVKGERNLFYLTVPVCISYSKLIEKGKIGFITGPELSVLAYQKSTIKSGKFMPAVNYPRIDAGWSIGINATSNKGYGARLQYCFGLRDTWEVDYNRNSEDFTTRNNELKISLYYLFGGGII